MGGADSPAQGGPAIAEADAALPGNDTSTHRQQCSHLGLLACNMR
jgi:hypothetical protein